VWSSRVTGPAASKHAGMPCTTWPLLEHCGTLLQVNSGLGGGVKAAAECAPVIPASQ
jgi:hypothetical protein